MGRMEGLTRFRTFPLRLIPICLVSFVFSLLKQQEQEDLNDSVSLIYREDTGLSAANQRPH